MTLYMETTQIKPADTVNQIQKVLSLYPIVSVLIEYDKGEVSAISFAIKIKGQEVPFRLPCRWESIEKILLKRKKNSYLPQVQAQVRDQSKRVAWRQILRWVEAQLALTDTGMVDIEEVFLPYILNEKGETLYQQFLTIGPKMIEYREGK